MKKQKIKQREKMTGEHWTYFFWHNFISTAIFFIIALQQNLFNIDDITLSYILSQPFLDTVIFIIIVSCGAEVIGRLVGYYLIIRPWAKYVIKRDSLSIREISVGFNRFSYRTVISIIITSFLFSIGALFLIEGYFFAEKTFWTLVISYVGFKLGIFIFIKLFIK